MDIAEGEIAAAIKYLGWDRIYSLECRLNFSTKIERALKKV